MAWLIIAVQLVLGIVDGYFIAPRGRRLTPLLGLLIDVPSILLIVYSVEPFGVNLAILQVVAISVGRRVMWYAYEQGNKNTEHVPGNAKATE